MVHRVVGNWDDPGDVCMVRSFIFISSTQHKESDAKGYIAGYSLAYSALALFRIGTSGSASLQTARKAS